MKNLDESEPAPSPWCRPFAGRAARLSRPLELSRVAASRPPLPVPGLYNGALVRAPSPRAARTPP